MTCDGFLERLVNAPHWREKERLFLLLSCQPGLHIGKFHLIDLTWDSKPGFSFQLSSMGKCTKSSRWNEINPTIPQLKLVEAAKGQNQARYMHKKLQYLIYRGMQRRENLLFCRSHTKHFTRGHESNTCHGSHSRIYGLLHEF